MFEQLHRSNIARNARVGVNFARNKSSEDLKKTLAHAFSYIQEKTKMDVEKKMKELADLFSKTSKELSEMVKQNEKFISEEMKRAEETIRKASKECSDKHMKSLQQVKDTYAKKVKECNEKAAKGLDVAKIKYVQQIEKADVLQNSIKQILKECLDSDDFVKCIASKTKDTTRERKEITAKLSQTVKSAEDSISEHLKVAMKCHADAQMESLQSLGKILKDTKDCVVQSR